MDHIDLLEEKRKPLLLKRRRGTEITNSPGEITLNMEHSFNLYGAVRYLPYGEEFS